MTDTTVLGIEAIRWAEYYANLYTLLADLSHFM